MAPTSPTPDKKALRDAALKARERAYAPYSSFRVGAALLTGDGTVFTGCNVENASYGLCLCAERTVIGSAIAAGQRDFRWLTIATASSPPSPPCGMCRQVIAEFSKDLGITLVNPDGEELEVRSGDLLPSSFDNALLLKGQEKPPGDEEKP